VKLFRHITRHLAFPSRRFAVRKGLRWANEGILSGAEQDAGVRWLRRHGVPEQGADFPPKRRAVGRTIHSAHGSWQPDSRCPDTTGPGRMIVVSQSGSDPFLSRCAAGDSTYRGGSDGASHGRRAHALAKTRCARRVARRGNLGRIDRTRRLSSSFAVFSAYFERIAGEFSFISCRADHSATARAPAPGGLSCSAGKLGKLGDPFFDATLLW
jgi:hypothetical protein